MQSSDATKKPFNVLKPQRIGAILFFPPKQVSSLITGNEPAALTLGLALLLSLPPLIVSESRPAFDAVFKVHLIKTSRIYCGVYKVLIFLLGVVWLIYAFDV